MSHVWFSRTCRRSSRFSRTATALSLHIQKMDLRARASTRSCPENGEDETNWDPPRSALLLLLPTGLKLETGLEVVVE